MAYFSWSGTSERIAKNIISQTNADSFWIEPETPYSDDYNTVAYGEAKEEADNNARQLRSLWFPWSSMTKLYFVIQSGGIRRLWRWGPFWKAMI